MIDSVLTRTARFADRHERAIAIASGVWLALSSAAYMPFLPIPQIPYVTDENSWILSGAWNALWWGFVHPALDTRRKALRGEAPHHEEPPV